MINEWLKSIGRFSGMIITKYLQLFLFAAIIYRKEFQGCG
jgi:hypothetical protein